MWASSRVAALAAVSHPHLQCVRIAKVSTTSCLLSVSTPLSPNLNGFDESRKCIGKCNHVRWNSSPATSYPATSNPVTSPPATSNTESSLTVSSSRTLTGPGSQSCGDEAKESPAESKIPSENESFSSVKFDPTKFLEAAVAHAADPKALKAAFALGGGGGVSVGSGSENVDANGSHAPDADEGDNCGFLMVDSTNDESATGKLLDTNADFQKVPEEVVAELDRYIVGQTEAKRSLAIALRDRWRRQQITDPRLRQEVTPNNILLVGPSGCGKTELARRLAKFVGAPFIKVVATKFTEVGFYGDDTQNMIQDLASVAYAEEFRKARDAVAIVAREKAYDALVTAHLRPGKTAYTTYGSAIALQILKDGGLDDEMVELDSSLLAPVAPAPLMGGFPPRGLQLGQRKGGMNSVSLILGGLGGMVDPFMSGPPGGNRKKSIKVRDALPLLQDHFAGKLVNEEETMAAAVEATEQRGIVFVDEFDKLIGDRDTDDRSSFQSKRRGVQKELLSLMEGMTVQTSLGPIQTDHILFVAAGAFTSSKPSDMFPELQGRLPIRCTLKSLTAADFVRILESVEYNALIQQQALLQSEGVQLEVTPEAIEEIASTAHQLNITTANVGARRLKTVIAKLLEDTKFAAHKLKGTTVTITPANVQETLAPLLQQSDLTRFII